MGGRLDQGCALGYRRVQCFGNNDIRIGMVVDHKRQSRQSDCRVAALRVLQRLPDVFALHQTPRN